MKTPKPLTVVQYLAVLVATSCTHPPSQRREASLEDAPGCFRFVEHETKLPPSPVPQFCQEVLDNLNQYCGGTLPYDRLAIVGERSALLSPDWQPVDADEALIKAIWVNHRPERYREEAWEANRASVLAEMNAGTARVLRANVRLEFVHRDGDAPEHDQWSVYRWEPHVANQKDGYRQARMMFSEVGEEAPSETFTATAANSLGELWSSRGTWGFVWFNPVLRTFDVSTLVRTHPRPDLEIAAPHECSIGTAETANREN